MKKLFNLFVIVFFLVSCQSSAADANGKLYLRTSLEIGSSHLNITWYYLGNDGKIIRNPKNGVNPVNYSAEQSNNAGNIGTYKIDGNKLNITWNSGSSVSWKLEFAKGEISAIDYGVVTRQNSLPTNYKLSGKFAGGIVAPNTSAIGTYNFNNDGTFTLNNTNTVTNRDVNTFTDKAHKGTYVINGNTLRLNFSDGQMVIANIAITDVGDGKKSIVINNTSYAQER